MGAVHTLAALECRGSRPTDLPLTCEQRLCVESLFIHRYLELTPRSRPSTGMGDGGRQQVWCTKSVRDMQGQWQWLHVCGRRARVRVRVMDRAVVVFVEGGQGD